MDDKTRTELEAAAFRRLINHLQHRTDVQNIDLMGHGGFCRNCLADWYMDAAEDKGIEMDKSQARETIYGMSYESFKEQHQSKASDEQLQRMKESVAKNK